MDVANFLAEEFSRQRCDGLFLPAVDHLGIRLPIRSIVERIRGRSELRFCFIDAAQAFCHVPLEECFACADFVVAGSHKWMGAYLPTGIGLFGQRRSREIIEHRVRQSEHIDDPLLHFTEQLDTGDLNGDSETANLASLFACAGAAADRSKSAGRAIAFLPELGAPPFPLSPPEHWRPIQPVAAMRSRILLLKSDDSSTQSASVQTIRNTWLELGGIVTAYEGGLVRLSVPPP